MLICICNWFSVLVVLIEVWCMVFFVWGLNDCVVFVVDVCLVIIGVDVLVELCGMWMNECEVCV